MGTHAERVAIKEQVSREDQDAFSLASQKAIAAIVAGRFEAEVAPVTVRDAKGRETIVSVDEGLRSDSTWRRSPGSSPPSPCPTARTAAMPARAPSRPATPRHTDGAAATVVASETAARAKKA